MKDATGNKRYKRLDMSQSAVRDKVLCATTNDEIDHIFDTDGFFMWKWVLYISNVYCYKMENTSYHAYKNAHRQIFMKKNFNSNLMNWKNKRRVSECFVNIPA